MKCVWLLLLLALGAGGSEIPEPVLPAGMGANIHFVTGHENELAMIRDAGFKFVRMDFGWAGIETKRDHYDWSGYEELLANLDKHGLRAILILDYSNPLYEETVTALNPMDNKPHTTIAAPQHPDSVAAFVRWAAAGVRHFRGRHVIWELWNEPNIEFWSPKPNIQQYSALALATCKAIREADPQATIIGPASSEFPWDFLEGFFQTGVLEYLDAVSVHPYRRPERCPETATADFQKLRQLIDRYAPAGRKGTLPILSGEWGYSTFKKGVSLETQASFAVRQQLNNLLNGVPLSIWYDWKNDGTDFNEKEDNWGTVMPDLSPKPAYRAFQTLTRELSGYRIAHRLPLADEKEYTLVCTNAAGEQKLAAWTTGQPHLVNLPISCRDDAAARVVALNGSTSPAKFDSGRLSLEFTSAPQYLALDK